MIRGFQQRDPPAACRHRSGPGAAFMLAGMGLLAACETTSVTRSARFGDEDFATWAAARDNLPAELHGHLPPQEDVLLRSLYPRRASVEVASLAPIVPKPADERMVMFINPAELPPDRDLCAGSVGFQSRPQVGRYTDVAAALCRGDKVVSVATGHVLTSGQTEAQMARSFKTITDTLFYALIPGYNDPDKYYY